MNNKNELIGKLCWFWDTTKQDGEIDVLEEIANDGSFFGKHSGVWWNNCEPVKENEVSFYKEEKEDTQLNVEQLIKLLQGFYPKAKVYAIPPTKINKDGYLKVIDAEQEFSDTVSLGLEE